MVLTRRQLTQLIFGAHPAAKPVECSGVTGEILQTIFPILRSDLGIRSLLNPKRDIKWQLEKFYCWATPNFLRCVSRCKRQQLEQIKPIVQDLHDTLMAFREKYNAGRAIAAPQIGAMKRVVYMYIGEPVVFINPVLDLKSTEMMELWDDCMSFPDLLVKVYRHQRCRITYRDANWDGTTSMTLEEDLSELLQHEVDHLDGILAVQRAIDHKSFALRSQRQFLW